ncbi:MAG TPA: hypothetical protein VHO03_16860 [Ignavibacteriales bacterium]|nr:hypothetical protein [Ignavibacteriales bacterium]
MKISNISKLDNTDREELEKLFQDLAAKIGHDSVRDLYKIHRIIRNRFSIKHFPVFLLYKISMFGILDKDEYSQMHNKDLAKSEGVCIKTVYNLKNEYWEKKKRKKK